MSTLQLSQQQRFSHILVQRVVPTLIESSVPFVTYLTVKQVRHTSDTVALSIGALCSACITLFGLVRSRHLSLPSVMALIGIVGSIALTLMGGSPKLLLIRESAMGGLFGIAFLVSLLFPKPLLFLVIREARAGRDAQRVAAFNQSWQSASTRRRYRLLTAVWGIGMLGEFLLRVVMVLTLSVPLVLGISSVLFPAIILGLIGWTILFMRRA